MIEFAMRTPTFSILIFALSISMRVSLKRARGWAVICDTCNTDQGLRSLPQLRERLTARADDNHAAPVLTVLVRGPMFPPAFHKNFKPW